MTTVIDETTFRQVLSRWPSGVGIVTTAGEDGWHGMTASSFSSVSLTPPLVLVCLDRRIRSHDLLIRNGVFAVNVLGRDHLALGRRFAGMEPGVADRFASGDWLPGATGSPVLTDSAAWVDCRVLQRYPGGDHSIFLGEVVAAGVPRITSPLLFHSRSWGQLADPLPERVELADIAVTDTVGTMGATGGIDAVGDSGGGTGPAGRLADALRRAGVRVRLTRPRSPEDGLGSCSFHATDIPSAVAAAESGIPVIEFTIAPDGNGQAAARMADAVRGAGGPEPALVVRIRDALHPDLARAGLQTVQRLSSTGCGEIVLEEPRGTAHDEGASPLALRRLLQDAVHEAGPVPLRLSLRDHHGLGLVNALTAMKSGVKLFDTSLGGHGNLLASERLVLLCSRMGIGTPVDVPALLALRTALDFARREPSPAWRRSPAHTAAGSQESQESQ
ncbi:flavin reductase [Streptomyces sp. NPDC058622]|uniref:flavin reductase n=2 Tax=unclassified Streptomyces TaxID=2593676 RepID=UPI00365AE002